MPRTTAFVVYEEDGTQDRLFTGYRISTQIFRGGRGMIRVYDKRGRVALVWHASKVYEITKTFNRG